jgi:RHS repeat-associated protein
VPVAHPVRARRRHRHARPRRRTPSHGCVDDYIYGPTNTPIEQINLATGSPTYLTYDPSDDTWLATNNTGTETGYWGYDAYGTLAYGTPATSFGYSGEYVDSTTGLINDRARWYNPTIGEFSTRDPEFLETDEAYLYGDADPVNKFDPTGSSCQSTGSVASPNLVDIKVPSGSSNQVLAPYTEYEFADENGRFFAEYYPVHAQIRWWFYLASDLVETVAGTVSESGLFYTVNGVDQAMNAEHPAEPPDYMFHGTMSGVPHQAVVEYLDYFAWNYENLGPVDVSIFGVLLTS